MPLFTRRIPETQGDRLCAIRCGSGGGARRDYCPSCIQMLPVFDTVSAEFNTVDFVKVDTDESPAIADKYLVQKIPFLLVFKDGKVAARYNRAMSKKELREFVQQFVNK